MAYHSTGSEIGRIEVSAQDMEHGRRVIVRGYAGFYPAFSVHLTTEEATQLATDIQNALAEAQAVAA